MKLLCLKNMPAEDLGSMWPVCHEWKIDVDTRELTLGDAVPESPEDYDALVILGGPMNVDEVEKYPFLAEEIRIIRQALAFEKPVLGVCLGAQLLARAGGARVYKGPVKEIGWYPLYISKEGTQDPIVRVIAHLPRVFQWHGDTFDLPDKAILLASSAQYQNQAFRIGKNAYALQFHVEITPDMIREWIHLYQDELAALDGQIDIRQILEEIAQYGDHLTMYARRLFEEFLRLTGRNSLKAPVHK